MHLQFYVCSTVLRHHWLAGIHSGDVVMKNPPSAPISFFHLLVLFVSAWAIAALHYLAPAGQHLVNRDCGPRDSFRHQIADELSATGRCLESGKC